MGVTVTSIKVDIDTWKQVKIRCIELDIELNKALAKALELWLETNSQKNTTVEVQQ